MALIVFARIRGKSCSCNFVRVELGGRQLIGHLNDGRNFWLRTCFVCPPRRKEKHTNTRRKLSLLKCIPINTAMPGERLTLCADQKSTGSLAIRHL